MTPERDEERQEGPARDEREEEIEGEVLSELDALDEDLLRQLSEDDRLSSGVPEQQRVDDEEFIQMSGLSAPEEAGRETAQPAQEDEPAPEDPSEPISFYEEGVADVDETMAPSQAEEVVSDAPLPPPRRNPPPETAAIPPRETEPAPSTSMHVTRSERPEGPRSGHGMDVPPPPNHGVAQEYVEALQRQEDHSEWEEEEERRPRKKQRPHLAPYRIDSESPDDAATRGLSSRRRRSSGSRRSRLQKKLVAAIALLLLVSIVSAVILAALQTMRMASPDETLRQAEELLGKERFGEAADSFFRFAKNHPNHPRAGEALFQSAYALQRRSNRAKPSDSSLETAVERFAKFADQFPNSPKAPRAKVLTGILAFRLRNYQRAIDILGDPELRAADPAAAVGILRALGGSYYKVGKIELARSSFLQAAALPSNIAPDADHTALGDMYAALAQSAASQSEAAVYADKAMEAWRFAEETSTVSKTETAAIQRKVAALRQTLETVPVEADGPTAEGPSEQEAGPGMPGPTTNGGGAAAEERMG